MRTVFEDVRYGLRLLRKTPVFTTVAILTLAIGIGANTAIYTLLDQVLLRSLPVQEPNRLALLRFVGVDTGSLYSRGDKDTYFSYPMYRDLREHNSVFNGLVATSWAQAGIQWHNEPEFVDAELVSGNYFDVLGLQPALGRLFVQADDVTQDANPVVVLSFNYWQHRFGLDPKILNQSISVNGHPFTVIGVAPPGFHSVVQGDNPAIFVPMMMKPEITPGWNDLDERRSKWLNIIGRLKPELSREKAQAGLDPLWRSIRADELKQMGHSSQKFIDAFVTNSHLLLDDGSKGVPLRGRVPGTLLVVMGLAGLMALMACANIASLLLVRVAHRTREISVRYALGARRARLVQQLLAEGVLLGLAGGAVREQLRSLDHDLPVFKVATLQQVVSSSLSQTRVSAIALSAFAGIALFLLAIGVYGVLAYTVSQSRHDIGVRLALGARREQILRLFLSRSVRWMAIGGLAGMTAAMFLVRFMRSLVFEVSTYDPRIFLGAAGTLFLVVILAGIVPAHRAAKVDPMVALRYE